jgi:Protein of unknown function (DUF2924)
MDVTLRQEIESLRKLKMKGLKARYRELFGEESPSSNHQHLFRRIAWRLQARAEGDLSARARQRAAQLAQDADLRLRAPRRFWKQLDGTDDGASPRANPDSRILVVGTLLKRVYQGSEIRVTVCEQGFEYEGRKYQSLSAIAQHVTGTRWNGYLFFALNRERGEQ